MEKKYHVLGLMSGTSLDGLDIAYCSFEYVQDKWNFSILIGDTVSYSAEWKEKLNDAPNMSGIELRKLDVEYGHFLGLECEKFIQKHQVNPVLVASHGHTVFHQPDKGFTMQIGNGQALRTHVNCNVIYDFRSKDVFLGGQGAPLVPIGDQFLFSQYDACINIGGFINISTCTDGKRIAWDIGPANILLNPIAEKLGYDYDLNGHWAREGKLNKGLYDALNHLEYYTQAPPKSLGKEWVNQMIVPFLEGFPASEKDQLHTIVEHISDQAAIELNKIKGDVYFTGGGVYNEYLMERIKEKTDLNIVIPDNNLVNYKEALIFGFMGLLRFRNENNILASVTGAEKDHSSGLMVG